MAGSGALHAAVGPWKTDRPTRLPTGLRRLRVLVVKIRSQRHGLDQTRRIIAAEEAITCHGWEQNGAGLAIRLTLFTPRDSDEVQVLEQGPP